MKRISFSLLLMFCVFLCSCTITKRKYLSGYSISWNKSSRTSSTPLRIAHPFVIKSTATAEPVSSIMASAVTNKPKCSLVYAQPLATRAIMSIKKQALLITPAVNEAYSKTNSDDKSQKQASFSIIFCLLGLAAASVALSVPSLLIALGLVALASLAFSFDYGLKAINNAVHPLAAIAVIIDAIALLVLLIIAFTLLGGL